MKTQTIDIAGKLPSYIKKEEVRAVMLATVTVCSYHGHSQLCGDDRIKLVLTKTVKELGKNDLTGGKCWGWAKNDLSVWDKYEIAVWRGIPDKDQFITVLIHEILHICCKHDGGQEQPTSTLTDKLKPMVVAIANTLCVGVYQRAAWFAHCKIAYKRTRKKDAYNDKQWSQRLVTNGTKL